MGTNNLVKLNTLAYSSNKNQCNFLFEFNEKGIQRKRKKKVKKDYGIGW